jgi:membrane peptidoglycan carboxypeptidase
LERFVDQGSYPIYGEKSRAGVKLFDRDQNPLYQASYPERAYKNFSSIPPLVVDSLLFIEDHDLLDLKDRSATRPSNGAGSCSP